MPTPLIPFDSPSVTNQIIDNFQDQPEGLYIVRTSKLTEHPKPVVNPDDIGTGVVVTDTLKNGKTKRPRRSA
jgi:hypothetical protein